MDFCPNCGTRLTPLKKKEGRKVALLLFCPKCGYEKRATRPMTTVSKIIEHFSSSHSGNRERGTKATDLAHG
jgi:DNA-directed RNA polymerase subunit M/transcription elongation factor TFIIS